MHRPARLMSRTTLTAAVALLAQLAFLFPQAPTKKPTPAQQQTPTFRVSSNLVLVDCIVRDKKGNPVRDLRRSDFTVYEDGVPQEIVTFALEEIPGSAPETAAAAPAAPAPTPAAAPPAVTAAEPPKPAAINLANISASERVKDMLKDRRLIILFFDMSSLETEDLVRSVTTAEEFITKRSTPHDLIAIATYSSVLQMVQDLTNDRELLLKTLRRLNPTDAGNAAEEDLGDEVSDDVFVPDEVQFNIFNTDRRLSAIETLSKAYREFPERKSLIYFSSGMTTTGIENQSQ